MKGRMKAHKEESKGRRKEGGEGKRDEGREGGMERRM